MPFEIKDCDDGIGNVMVLYGLVTNQERMDVLKAHLTQDKEKFKKYPYILFHHKGLTNDAPQNHRHYLWYIGGGRFCLEI
jgi:hypothetical protein